MGRVSYIPFTGTVYQTEGTVDLVEVAPDDDRIAICRGFCIGQVSELGDAAEEVIDLQLVRMTQTVTSGSTGTVGGGSASPFHAGNVSTSSVSGYTAEVFNFDIATTSGETHVLYFPWNVRSSPYVEWFPDAAFALRARQGGALILRIGTAVADDMTVSGWFCVEIEGE